MARLAVLLCLLACSPLSSARRLFGRCDFETADDQCGLTGSNKFEHGEGRPAWNNNAMDSGYSGAGYFILTGYNSEQTLSTPQMSVTSGDEQVSFAYFLNGAGVADSYIRLFQKVNGEEVQIYEGETTGTQWTYVTVDITAPVGSTFQLVWRSRADRNMWTNQHTYLALDYIEVVNEGGPRACYRPPPVQYANSWSCSTRGVEAREQLSDGTVCTSTCRDGFVQQGEALLLCSDGSWVENGDIAFLCIDEQPPQFSYCPLDQVVNTPYGWASMWYNINPPFITDNTDAYDVQLYLDGELQSTSSQTINAGPGVYQIKFVATDYNYNQNECSYAVTVQRADKSNPTVLYCPMSSTYESASPMVVTWPEPVFTDDTGYIASVTSTYDPNSVMGWGRHDVIYTAYDNSSNPAVCSFVVTIRGVPCHDIALPAYGALVCHDTYSGRFCISACGPEGDFQVPSGDLSVPSDYLCSSSGNWYPYEFTYNCLAPYGDAPVMSSDYYFSGMCNETATQSALQSQALRVFNTVETNIPGPLYPSDFYVLCGPHVY